MGYWLRGHDEGEGIIVLVKSKKLVKNIENKKNLARL